MTLRAVSNTLAGGLAMAVSAYPNNPITGDTSEHNMAAIRIPANTMGANGSVRVMASYSYANTANNKIMSVRVGASGITSGGLAITSTQTTTVAFQLLAIIRNANATGSQVTQNVANGFGAAAAANNATTVDTTADFFVNINGQLGSGAETLTLNGYTVEVLHG